MKKHMILFITTLIIVFTGCSIIEDEKQYDVDDYRIIEIAYFDSMDQKLLAKSQKMETDKEIIELINNDGIYAPFLMTNHMCYIFPNSEYNDGGIRILNNVDGRYLESAHSVDKKYGYIERGIFDGENTFCNSTSSGENNPGDEDARLAYRLADLFMSETKNEISEKKDLEKYADAFAEDEPKYYGKNADSYFELHSIRFYDKGTTRLVRMHMQNGDSEGGPYDGVYYIQISLNNDVDSFNTLYDDIYYETVMRKE